ncbi:hypothetical protein [Sphingobium sp. DC-2]|uniref:hypothetical protein n=1 Tax=Sphingobium sp. DC-2 TaxID=1303256 RepID=UPI0004C460EC|nr:hypothetical protein [Sphingobium sp. DC-2]
MRRPAAIHAATCRCDRCRPLAERLAETSIRVRALITAAAIAAAIIIAIFGPLVAAAIKN